MTMTDNSIIEHYVLREHITGVFDENTDFEPNEDGYVFKMEIDVDLLRRQVAQARDLIVEAENKSNNWSGSIKDIGIKANAVRSISYTTDVPAELTLNNTPWIRIDDYEVNYVDLFQYVNAIVVIDLTDLVNTHEI